MKIDVHNHFYPKRYLEKIQKINSNISTSVDSMGRKVIIDRGIRIVTITEKMSNPQDRIEDMDKAGMDMQVLTLTTPNVNFANPEDSYELSKIANDEIASVTYKYPGRFLSLASLPLKDINLAMKELDRCLKELGMKGIIIGSNIDGKPLDSEEFVPLYRRAEELNIPIFIHPMTPMGGDALKTYCLAPLIGFEFDITLALSRIVFSGIIEKFPGLKIIVSHLGGAMPFLMERMDNGYRAYPECRENISKPPSYYLKKIFYDTVSFHEPALMCAYNSVGASQLVIGSDYPHVIGDLPRSISSIENLKISPEEKETIFSNGIRIMNLSK